ncbi:MAG: glutamate--tRNA ligase [Bacteroidetes bacterium]|nr:MAG: glutamate--tRNA ligase [Bacteroidota bacterium]
MATNNKVRVRFAPSPTGGLHLGGVRTVLFNYLFAKQHKGDFILRIEDTDQSRFVPGAEQYIVDCLTWCGLIPDESPSLGGDYAPYRQSERKPLYRQYAEQLVESGHAYYAFDTPEELDAMRAKFKSEHNASPQYDHQVRMQMRNSLSLPSHEIKRLLDEGIPHVIRIKMPVDEVVGLKDMIRGGVNFNTSQVDDKVLLKGDGMPTYHLAVVVDDYLMKITHAFRGEEWLPSAAVHVLLWKYLGWEDAMPQWAHLPLILKPDGNGKLSKRDGDRLGFPVFAMDWLDPKTNELTKGFKELGFLPSAFINLLAMLGWNDGTTRELFTLDELIHNFSIERVHKGGAKFDFEKAKWFNHEWIKNSTAKALFPEVKKLFEQENVAINNDAQLERVIELTKERCTLLTDFITQGKFFFVAPEEINGEPIKAKWNSDKANFFEEFSRLLKATDTIDAISAETIFKNLATEKNIKPGELQLPLRIMLVGDKYGPPVFDIAATLGKDETCIRILSALAQLP